MALAALSACQSVGQNPSAVPTQLVEPAATGEMIGAGGVRVALLLPKSAPGNGAATAAAFRNAAELAIRDFPSAGIQIAVYDTGGTPDGALAAVGDALREDAEIILGPVFSGEVAAVAGPARQAGVPVVAFSSDASVAAPGVYLLSFLPSDDVNRIVAYSASQGRKSFAALLPANAYGSVAEATFRRAVAAAGGRIVAIESYDASGADIAAKAGMIAASAAEIDALLIPDGADAVSAIAATLAAGGVTREKVKFLGSGQWDDPRILNNPALVGSWFPAPAKQGFETFSGKYQAAYGAAPPRNATLAYDGAVLAAGLVRQFGAERFGSAVLTSPNGFAGLDGIFRFQPTGQSERRLSVFEVTGSGARVIGPATRSFASGS
ncbi:MAG: penicillin-binding protein activator [Pseudomonadota bacterium]|nr:penicillin-binding protein activator [Pseudomonadota bacterium]